MKKLKNLKDYIINSEGRFGKYGGRFVPEMLVGIMDSLAKEFFSATKDEQFLAELTALRNDFAGRPTPLLHLKKLSENLDGAQIYLKNEGLLHTGAHKMNHCLGQGILCKRLKKTRVIAETGAGQHGLATATMCAKLGLECVIYMGAKDVERQRPNVFWMEKLGAKVQPVYEGGQVLRDAINAALRDLMANSENTHYLLGTVCGPHPYPAMNAYFQRIIGEEVRARFLKDYNKLPDTLVACVGGGSNALGLFQAFLDDDNVEMIGVEAGGTGDGVGENACRFSSGSEGVSEGMKSYFLHDNDGQMLPTHSISAGLDYSGVSPQMAYLNEIKRVKFTSARDDKVMEAWSTLAHTEGIFPALESAHALAETIRLAPTMSKDKNIVVNMSGRGDKDLFIVSRGDEKFREFLKRQI